MRLTRGIFSTCSKLSLFSYAIGLRHYSPISSSPQEIPLLSQHIPQLVQFFIQAGSNRNLDSDLRILGLNALNWTVL